MNNVCPNPNCGAMYNLTAQHVGRGFPCKKCNMMLLVAAAGLELAPTSPGGEPMSFPNDDLPPPERRPTRLGANSVPNPLAPVWERIKADAATWSFGAGAFFTILCLFLPLLDDAKTKRRLMRVEAGDRKQQRLNEELTRREQEAKASEREALKKDREARDAAFKEWREKDRVKLQEEADEARDAEKIWSYWYILGTMLGFLSLALGALGYLTPQQSTIRRIVGSIVICAMMLLLFMKFLVKS